jgi:hypothetical protein
MALKKVGGGRITVVDVGPTNGTVYTASGTVILQSTDPNATLTNNATGHSVTGEEIVLQNGESLSIDTNIHSHLYRTKEK